MTYTVFCPWMLHHTKKYQIVCDVVDSLASSSSSTDCETRLWFWSFRYRSCWGLVSVCLMGIVFKANPALCVCQVSENESKLSQCLHSAAEETTDPHFFTSSTSFTLCSNLKTKPTDTRAALSAETQSQPGSWVFSYSFQSWSGDN